MKRGRAGPLRLLKSLRGDGTLMFGRRSTRPVTYCVDLYGQGAWLTGDGDVRGEFADLIGRAPADVRLRFSDGQEAAIALRDIETGVASIELLDPVPQGLGSPPATQD